MSLLGLDGPAKPQDKRTAKWRDQKSPTGSQDELVTIDTTGKATPPPGYSTTVDL